MFALSDSMRDPFASSVQRSYIVHARAGPRARNRHRHKNARPQPPDTQQMIGVQVALDRAGFSPGEIDGRGGPKTKLALSEFQKSAGLPATGVVNEETIAALTAPAEPVVTYTIAAEDVAGPFIGSMPGDMMESAKLPALGIRQRSKRSQKNSTRARRCCKRSILARRGPPATPSKCRLWNRSSRSHALRKQRRRETSGDAVACR